MGSNYEGAIPEEQIKRLGEVVAPGVEIRWFLDKGEWAWTRGEPVVSNSIS